MIARALVYGFGYLCVAVIVAGATVIYGVVLAGLWLVDAALRLAEFLAEAADRRR